MATAQPVRPLTRYARVHTGRFRFGAAVGANPRPRPFRRFVDIRNPTLLDYDHVPRLVDVADRVAQGILKRVLVLLPPRYYKTETFSRLFPAHYLRRFPDRNVGLASYGAELAWSISEEAKLYYQQDGGTLRHDTHAKKRWKTEAGGEMWAAGVGGPLLGFGYHLGIVDDPTDPEKAHSPTYQRRFEEWWPAKFLSRQEPDAAIVFVMQRLGTSDPIDFLLRREVGEETDLAPEHWHVVVCDEIKSDVPLGRWNGPRGLPPTCTLEDDPRATGEVLAPSRFDKPAVEALQRSAGSYVAQAQRQQRPSAPTGDFWRKDWFLNVYDELPADAHNGGKDWDTAYTKEEHNSASAYVESYRGVGKPDQFPIYIHNLDWDWLEFPELVYWMGGKKPEASNVANIIPVGGPHHVEDKATGKSSAQTLRSQGVPVSLVSVEGDKFKRAADVQPVVASGRVWVRREVLRKLLEGERQGLLRVTAETLVAGGPDLDVNDAFVQAINRHTKPAPRRHTQGTRIMVTV